MTVKNVFILLALATGILLTSSCNKDDNMNPSTGCIKGEGTITTSTLSIADFTGVDLTFADNVTVNQGSTQKVETTGHPNIIERITTSVSNDIWTIGLESGCYEEYELSIEITIPDINSLALSGSGNLVINDFSNQSGELSIGLSGSGDVTLNDFTDVSQIDATLSGSGNITANKRITVETLNVSNSGSGKFSVFEINSNDCTVISTGSGHSEVTAQNNLDVTISGNGNISYKGTPTITQDVSGSGELIDAN